MSGSEALGLGTSLAAVFARTPKQDQQTNKAIANEIEIGHIRPASANPRRSFDQAALEELAASIRVHGVLQPIVLLKRNSGYEILAGERRYRAAAMAGLTRIPAIVRDEDNPQHTAELRLIENIQRENLNPMELARAYQALLEHHGLSHDDLASRMGKDRSSISNVVRLMALPQEVQHLIEVGAVSLGHAKVILGAATAEDQVALARAVVDEALSVRSTEVLLKKTAALVADEAGNTSGPAVSGTSKPAHIRELETNLTRLLGSPVRITGKGQSGTITVSFTGKAAFQRIVEVLDQACKDASRLR